MNLEEIKQKLRNSLTEVYEYPYEDLREYFEEITAHNLFKNEEVTIDPTSLLLTSLIVNCEEDEEKMVPKVKDMIEHELLDNFSEFSKFYLEFQKLSQKNKQILLQSFSITGKENLEKHLDKLQNENKEEDVELTLKYLALYLNRTSAELNDILPLIEFISNLTLEQKESFDFFAYYSILINSYENDKDPSLSKEANNCLRRNYNAIVDAYCNLEKEKRQGKKEFLKKQEVSKKLLKKLETPFHGYQQLTEEEIKYLPVTILDDIENMYLVWNQKELETIEKELEVYNGNKEEKIKKLFQSFSLPFTLEREQIKALTKIDYQELEEKLSIMKNYLIPWSEKKLFPVLCMKLDAIKELVPYFITNMISASYFVKNIELFQEENIAQRMEKNVNFMKRYSLNCKEFNELLLKKEEELAVQFQRLENKGLKITEAMVKASFVPNFFPVYDLWESKNLQELFLKNLEVLQNDFIGITKRVWICCELNIPVFDEDGRLNSMVTSESKFFLQDNKIDEYVDPNRKRKLEKNKD